MNTDKHGFYACRHVVAGLAILLFIAGSVACRADEGCRIDEQRLDWTCWQAMPVMDVGRRMPLDTFARETVRAICGRENPRLFVDGQTKKYSAAELLFAWLAEPEKWRDVAFLRAGNERLRQDILDVPARDAAGNRLRYISPRSLEESASFHDFLNELLAAQRKAEADGRNFSLEGVDEAVAELNKAHGIYCEIVFDPRSKEANRRRFFYRLAEVLGTWRSDLASKLQPWLALKGNEPLEAENKPEEKNSLGAIVDRTDQSLASLVAIYHREGFSLADVEPSANELCAAADDLNAYFDDVRNRTLRADDENKKILQQARVMMSQLAGKTRKFKRECDALQRSLLDAGRVLRTVPALDPWALELERDPANSAQPWLSLQAMLFGSPETLGGLPAEKLAAVRESFAEAQMAYTDRAAAERPKRFAQAIARFTAAMRELGESLEPLRQALPIKRRDAALLAATTYPPPDYTAVEVFYNRLDPFLWSWVLTLVAIVCFCLMFGALRRPMFFCGLVVLITGQGFTICGLWLRADITGMVPVTNMFETVLFVGATVAILGIWFTMLPMIWPGLSRVWELTAAGRWKDRGDETDATHHSKPNAAWTLLRVCVLLVRAALSIAMIYLLAIGNFNPSGDGPVLSLLPESAGTGLGSLGSTLVLWAIGLPIFLWMVWFFPRAIPAIVLGTVLIPWTLARQGFKEKLDESIKRRVFVIAGGSVALVAYLVAYFAPGPIFNRGVGLEMAAVLRNNFWLAVHVLIITASYGAGALAWGLGNVSLGFYAFGRYDKATQGKTGSAASGGDTHIESDANLAPNSRPPRACVTLAGYTYRVVQLAVLLLAAGTITGAIWADYAWGRYWGWDPKEVWALVTLLVYMVILHGRWAGWAGDFGMAVGAVLGATSIMMAWYGVNFILAGGLHSYGFSSGGQTPVLIIVGLNWCFVALAAVRHRIAQRR